MFLYSLPQKSTSSLTTAHIFPHLGVATTQNENTTIVTRWKINGKVHGLSVPGSHAAALGGEMNGIQQMAQCFVALVPFRGAVGDTTHGM